MKYLLVLETQVLSQCRPCAIFGSVVGGFLSEHFGFILPASPLMLHTHLISSAGKIRQFKAAVPKGFTLTSLQQLGRAEPISPP
jgi:hypothetical protein